MSENGPLSHGRALEQFAIHVGIAVLAFVVLALAAAGLDYFTSFMAALGVDAELVSWLRRLEYALFAVDALMLLVLVSRAALRLVKEF
jgi:hypothetical protein